MIHPSKPEHYQYSFQQLATNTNGLLRHIGVQQAVVIGHSTGGMLTTPQMEDPAAFHRALLEELNR